MFEFNINNHVYVQLTDVGVSILKKRHDELQKCCPTFHDFHLPKVDKDGWTKYQLHDLMNTFGNAVSLGYEIPFYTKIRFEKNDMREVLDVR